MKEKVLKLIKSKSLFAILLNIVFMAICVGLTSFSYVDVSDYNNSILICNQHFYYNSSINYILAVLIGTLQYAVSDFNCFVLVEILLSFMAFSSFTFVFLDKYNIRKAVIFSIVINIIFTLNHYSYINSTKTAALLLTAGFLLVLNAIRNKRYSFSCWLGVVEILIGSFFNIVYFFVALGFAIAFFFGDMIAKRKYRLDFQKLFWYFRPYLLMFLLIAALGVGLSQFSYTVNHATEQGESYYDYSQLTKSIDSLPYPGYDENAEEFKQAGIDNDSEYELLKNGYYDDSKMLNNDALRLVSKLQKQENTKTVLYAMTEVFTDLGNNIATFSTRLIVMIVYLAISIVFILYHKNRFSFFPLFYLLSGYAASVVLRYLYNGAEYLTYGIWLLMIVLLINSFNFEVLRSKKPSSKLRLSNGYFIMSIIVTVALTVSYATLFVMHKPADKSDEAPNHLISEISRNPDYYYVMDTQTRKDFVKYTENYLHPLWGFRDGYLENLDSFGYFHNTELLRKRNLPENIYEAVLKNRKIQVIDKNITFKKEKYFNTNYVQAPQTAVYNQVDEIDNYKLYEVEIR